MGNSAPTAQDGDDFVEFDGIETLGYRVLGVQPNSPAAKAGLVSFFDFLLGANEQMLLGSGEELEEGEEYDDIDFPALLQENKGQVVELLVWNIKAQEKRLVELIPNVDWGGAGMLGVTIKLDNYGGADERLIRVLEVEDSSPAAQAGLVPMKDYLLGTTVTAFGSTEVLAGVLQEYEDQVVEIYVYNSDSDMVRVVALMPTLSWGGRGLLGAEVGTGYLHRLPNSCRDSIGQSVERKVRITNKGATTTDSEVDENAGEPSQEETLLEMEPHLEMEIERDVNNRHLHPEDVTKQPHQLGSTEVQPKTAVGAPRNEAEERNLNTSSAATEERAPQTASSEPSGSETVHESQPNGENSADSSTQQMSTAPLPPPPPLVTATSAEDAAALFDGPPPASSESTNQQGEIHSSSAGYNNSTPFMPAPPKMTY